MTDLDRALVRRKLAAITQNLADLAPIAALSLAAYRADRLRRKAVERLLQEVVEAAVDANLHTLRALGGPVPGDYYTSFIEAGRRGVVPPTLAERLAPSAGLRNRLVHEYDAIDDAIVLAAVGQARQDFAAYVQAVERFLGGAEKSER
ncbi:MAG: type VII toxin-antitoxin system HepT family RNase toxin [Gemmatimonadales bacterium]